jgi:tetratricopeptide (TPR) repeat protein
MPDRLKDSSNTDLLINQREHMLEMAIGCCERGEQANAEKLFKVIIDGSSDSDEADTWHMRALFRLAMLCNEMMRFQEAIDFGQQWLEQHGNDDDDSRAELICTLGHALAKLGYFRESNRLFDNELSNVDDHDDDDDDDAVVYRATLLAGSAVPLALQGRFEAALERRERGLSMLSKTLGRKDVRVLRAVAHLANSLCDADRYADAETMLRQRVLSTRHVTWSALDRATWLHFLARVRIGQGRTRDGAAICYETLDVLRTCSDAGTSDPRYLSELSLLGAAFGRLGLADERKDIFEFVCDVRTRTLGAHHAGTATSLCLLASAHVVDGEHKAAIELFERALDVYRDVGNMARSSHCADVLLQLCAIHASLTHFGVARTCLQEAVEIARDSVPSEHRVHKRCTRLSEQLARRGVVSTRSSSSSRRKKSKLRKLFS